MADIFDVVADPTRRQLLSRLLQLAPRPGVAGEISVGQLVTELGISQPTVSKHLKTLREHGLVTVREEGQHRYYRLDPAPLIEVEEFIGRFAELAGYSAADREPDPLAAVHAAWAGTEVGSRLGRVAANTAFGARSAIQGAQERLGEALPWAKRG
jgi:ArsR family transcriptional regulator, arsenate/arsenite/antimonite-responsive transcriptional repressor